MTLSQALRELYPNLNPAFDYMVIDALDGEGQKLVQWDEKTLGTRPSEEMLSTLMAMPYTAPPEPSVKEKLMKATGLSASDLKAALQELIADAKP